MPAFLVVLRSSQLWLPPQMYNDIPGILDTCPTGRAGVYQRCVSELGLNTVLIGLLYGFIKVRVGEVFVIYFDSTRLYWKVLLRNSSFF